MAKQFDVADAGKKINEVAREVFEDAVESGLDPNEAGMLVGLVMTSSGVGYSAGAMGRTFDRNGFDQLMRRIGAMIADQPTVASQN